MLLAARCSGEGLPWIEVDQPAAGWESLGKLVGLAALGAPGIVALLAAWMAGSGSIVPMVLMWPAAGIVALLAAWIAGCFPGLSKHLLLPGLEAMSGCYLRTLPQ